MIARARSTVIWGWLLATAGFVSPAPGSEVSTSFEFEDLSGEFTLGTSPYHVTFRGGEAKSIGIFALYHSGNFSWVINPGQTGEITFETPAEQIELFIRDQALATDGVLTVFDAQGTVIVTVDSAVTSWTTVAVTRDPTIESPIGRITLENTGSSGVTVMDDFTYCAIQGGAPLEDPIPEPITSSDVHVVLDPVAAGLTAPNWGVSPPGWPGRLAITDQDGVLWMIDLNSGEKWVFLDVSDRLVSLGVGGPGTFDERGLLGVAFHPDYETNGLLYTYTSEPVNGAADFSTMPVGETPNHQSVVAEWEVPFPTDPLAVVDPGTRRENLRIDQPQFNHDGGGLVFGPDGMLFISLGDGGAGDDQGTGHGETGNGRDPGTILGAIIRIDPLGTNGVNGQYGVPPDNPFVDTTGFLDEIYAYGLRNPFRFSFDSETGDLYVADVGQNDIEEIDLVTASDNLGWNYKEGSFFFDPNGPDPGFVTDVDPGVPGGLIDPIAEYDHDEGIAIVGGFVYRGAKIPALRGRYVFGDFAGRLFHLTDTNEIVEFNLVDRPGLGLSVLGFGQDAAGELYLLANETGVPFEDTGVVLRIAVLPGDAEADGDVDLTDFVAFRDCLAGPATDAAAACVHLDLTTDGPIDLRDFGAFARSFTDGS